MKATAQILVGIVAALHFGFLGLEMFHWTGSDGLGVQVGGMSEDAAVASARLAMNQGIYNGFLAAGLVWALLVGPRGNSVKVFCLICAVIAGVCGALLFKPVNPVFLIAQALPAALALGWGWWSEAKSGSA